MSYGYDLNLNLGNISNANQSTENKNFAYHLNNRLQNASYDSTSTSYEYDGVGNRILQSAMDINGTTDDSYQYVWQSNRLASVNANSATYDEVGNSLTSAVREQRYSYRRCRHINDSHQQ